MKKIFISLFLLGIMGIGLISSCGEAYKPLTTEQLEAKVDSLFDAKAAETSADLTGKCDSMLEESVKARMEELTNK